MTRVFEDLDTPGQGQPYRVEVLVDLVDALTLKPVKEAYYNGTTIVGMRRANVDGTPAQWNRIVQGMARAQWEMDLAPNAEITYRGSPGGTYWRRQVNPFPPVRDSVKKTRTYIDVPASDQRLILGDLVVANPDDGSAPDYIWTLVAGDGWSRNVDFDGVDMTGYTLELELRRSFTGMVRAEATFDYTNAAEGSIDMTLDGDVTDALDGNYVAALQQYDSDNKRTTLASWLFVFQRRE